MNTVNIKINGMEYNLKGEEKQEYLQRVAAHVDKKIKNLLDNNSKLNVSSAAVLTAINAVDDLFKCDMAYKELCEELEGLEQNQASLKEQVEGLNTQLKHMEDYNAELKNKIEESAKIQEEQVFKITKELTITEETAQKHISESSRLKSENKELKFELQSSKYKIMELQNKLIENQISLAKAKKDYKNPLKNTDS